MIGTDKTNFSHNTSITKRQVTTLSKGFCKLFTKVYKIIKDSSIQNNAVGCAH